MALKVKHILHFLGYFVAFSLAKIMYLSVKELSEMSGNYNIISMVLDPTSGIMKTGHDKFVSDSDTIPLHSIDCGNLSNYDALIMVHSRAWDFRRRHDYRITYGSPSFTKPVLVKLVFLIGRADNRTVQKRIRKEHALYQDVIQGYFKESQDTLNYKAVMGIRWIFDECTDVNVIIKMDDNVLIDVRKFFKNFWPPPGYLKDMIHCHVVSSLDDRRVRNAYCRGYLVVIPYAVVTPLYKKVSKTQVAQADDLFLYGNVRTAAKLQMIFSEIMTSSWQYYEECIDHFGARCNIIAAVHNGKEPFTRALLNFIKLNSDDNKNI